MALRNRIFRRDAEHAAEPTVVDVAEPALLGDPVTEHMIAVDPLIAPEATEPAPEGAAPAPAETISYVATSAHAAQRRPGFRERGRLRRRLRFLRESRELGFRDLGGLVFDQHRFQRPDAALVQGKVAAIEAADRELRAIEQVLGAQRPYEELFIAGASACQRCGALHGSDARYCPSCGLAFSGPRAVAGVWTDQAPVGAAPGQSALFDPSAARSDAPVPPA